MILHDKVRRWLAFCNPVKSITTAHFRGQLVALTMIQVCTAMLHMGERSDLWPAWILPKQHYEQRRQCGTRQHNTGAGEHKINGEAPEMDERNGSPSSPDPTLYVCMIQSSTTNLKYHFVLTNWDFSTSTLSLFFFFYQVSAISSEIWSPDTFELLKVENR